MLIDLLKAQYVIWGLSAPKFAWWAAALLLMMPLSVIAYLWWTVRSEFLVLAGITRSIRGLNSDSGVLKAHGLPPATIEKLERIFSQAASVRTAWHGFSSLLILHHNGSGEDRYWATDSADLALSDAVVFKGRINRSFYAAIPAIVTGTGLLFTFLAILVALLDVKIDSTNQVHGLSLLIEGLSGKFVSSIGALLGATIYMLAEKPLMHRLTKARLNLVQTVDSVMPRMTPVTLLAELRRDVSEQTKEFRSLNSNLTLRWKESFTEGVRPAMERVAEAVEDLTKLLHRSESQKHEEINHSLQEMMLQVRQSITASLDAMGQSFKHALSGSAMDQLTAVAESVGDTARLLQSMNAQFEMTQSALNRLVEMARSSVAEQVALGRTQIADLTAVLRQFMLQMNESSKSFSVQMNESVGESSSRIAAAFTGVMHELADNVNTMQQQFNNLAGMAKFSAEQVVLGRTQIDELAGVLRQFMVQIGESADTSAARIATAFTDATRDLSANVGDLQQQIKNLIGMANASAKQIAVNRTQVDDFRTVLQQFVAQMNESAGTSAGRIEAALAPVMGQLCTHVKDFQQQFNDLAGMARTSAEQIALSRAQLDEFASALRQYVIQMNESTGKLQAQVNESTASSVAQISASLRSVAHEVAAHVNEMQQQLNNLAAAAKASTAEQMALGRTQVDELAAVLREFMVQVNESAGLSANQIESAFAGVIQELTARVGEMQKNMAASMQMHAEKASAAASAAASQIMEQAGSWTVKNKEQFDILVKQYELQAKGVQEMEAAMGSALGMVSTSVTQYSALNADFRKIAAEVSGILATSAASTQNMQKTQRSIEQVATYTAHQIEQANRAQKEVWTWIYDNIRQYKDIFELTENRAHDLIAQMADKLGTHVDSNRQMCERLINEADGQLALATRKLGASVTDLTAFLQNLTENLKKAQGSGDGHRS